jgi:hypothetical protein
MAKVTSDVDTLKKAVDQSAIINNKRMCLRFRMFQNTFNLLCDFYATGFVVFQLSSASQWPSPQHSDMTSH